MDPLRLLSRSTKLSKKPTKVQSGATLPSAQDAKPQIFSPHNGAQHPNSGSSKKRKRGRDDTIDGGSEELGLNFFGENKTGAKQKAKPRNASPHASADSDDETDEAMEDVASSEQGLEQVPEEERKHTLWEHKIKVTWLNPPKSVLKAARKSKGDSGSAKRQMPQVFPQALDVFGNLHRYGVSKRVQENVCSQGYSIPTEVQLSALPLLLQEPEAYPSTAGNGVNLLTVAPTGSGKTLAFVIPLFTRIARERRGQDTAQKQTTALILAPTKELVGQIVNEGRKLAIGTGIKIAQIRKGMQLQRDQDKSDPEGESEDAKEPAIKADILVSTPGVLYSIIQDEKNKRPKALPAVQSLVLDEADVLLDPLFREQTLAIWRSLPNSSLRVSLWSATMGSNIEDLARSTIDSLGTAADVPLLRLVVGLKDSAVPNVEHKLVYAATEQGKLMGLRQLLHPTSTTADSGPPLMPPFLVFTQTIERAVALHSELLYDIPAEAGGISRIAVLHSDLSDTARDSVMTRFRKGEVWVLITTDLLSRGVDFRGVNGVVNYDIPTSTAAYVHRVGRTGRAGREGGVAVTLYSKEDIQYLRPIANVIAAAQKQKGVKDGSGIQQWLLDALPTMSKNDKQKLKKNGVEARTSRGMAKDPRAANKARISTKSGFVRKEENKRKGAILGSRRRAEADTGSDDGGETDFGGFD